MVRSTLVAALCLALAGCAKRGPPIGYTPESADAPTRAEEPPTGGGGFAFGADVAKVRAKCSAAHGKFVQSGQVSTCLTRQPEVGATFITLVEYCGGAVCRIHSLLTLDRADAQSWLVPFEHLRRQLLRQYGDPDQNDAQFPRHLRGGLRRLRAQRRSVGHAALALGRRACRHASNRHNQAGSGRDQRFVLGRARHPRSVNARSPVFDRASRRRMARAHVTRMRHRRQPSAAVLGREPLRPARHRQPRWWRLRQPRAGARVVARGGRWPGRRRRATRARPRRLRSGGLRVRRRRTAAQVSTDRYARVARCGEGPVAGPARYPARAPHARLRG